MLSSCRTREKAAPCLPLKQPLGFYLALLLPLIAAQVQWTFWHQLQPWAWPLFYAVILFAPLIGGHWAGIGATLISALCAWYLFIPPQLSWQFDQPSSLIATLIFLTLGIAFSLYQHRFIRLQTKAARFEGEQRFGATFNQTLVGIAETDPNGRLETVNDRYCEITGYPRHELLGRRMHDITHPADLPHNTVLFDRMIREGTPFTIEKRYKKKDGKTAWVNNSVSPIHNASGQLTGCFALVQEITERKTLERKLQEQRREQQELLTRLIAGQTTSAIANELNQPLQAITAYSEAALMMMQTGNPNPEKIRHAIRTSKQQARRAGQSIRQLIEALNRHDFPRETIDLNREIRYFMDLVRSEHEFNFDAALNLAPNLPQVLGNHIHLQNVLKNLIQNSIEALQAAETPYPILTITTQQDKNGVKVTIHDNGPGISPKDFPNLFTPFFTTKASAIGMGLSISRFLIEANDGRIWAESHQGPGATMHLFMPIPPGATGS